MYLNDSMRPSPLSNNITDLHTYPMHVLTPTFMERRACQRILTNVQIIPIKYFRIAYVHPIIRRINEKSIEMILK